MSKFKKNVFPLFYLKKQNCFFKLMKGAGAGSKLKSHKKKISGVSSTHTFSSADTIEMAAMNRIPDSQVNTLPDSKVNPNIFIL